MSIIKDRSGLVVVLLLATIEAAATPVQWKISKGGNGHYYEYFASQLQWEEAREQANLREFNGVRGHLVNISSAAENAFVASILPADEDFIWLGATDVAEEGIWVWADGPEAGQTIGPFEGWNNGEPNNGGDSEHVALFPGLAASGGENGLGKWNDGKARWHSSMVVEYSSSSEQTAVVAHSMSWRSSSRLHASAVEFQPPAGGGRHDGIGMMVPSRDLFESEGSVWEFNYQLNDKGVQLIHPYKDGQGVITIEKNSISLTTPKRWIETGYNNQNTEDLSYTPAFQDVFPLVGLADYHIRTVVDGVGRVLVFIDGLLVAEGAIGRTHPLNFFISPVETFRGSSTWAELSFSGDEFRLQWSKGLAGIILEPVDNAVNRMTDVTYSPGLVDWKSIPEVSVSIGPVLWSPDEGGNGHYYEFDPMILTWSGARKKAQERAGYLVNITSEEEDEFVFSLLGRGAGGHGWLGANDIDEEGRWVWADGPEAGQIFWTAESNSGSVEAYTNWVGGRADNTNNEDAALMNGPRPSGGVRFAGQWNDGGTNWTVGSLVEYSPSSSLVADVLSFRRSSHLHPAALSFEPPQGDGRGRRIGLLVPSSEGFESEGSEWSFDYRRNDRGVQLIHPFGNGQCLIVIERDSIGVATPRRWEEIGYRNRNTTRLSYTSAFNTRFPLDDYLAHHVQTRVDGSGRVTVSVDHELVAEGKISEAWPIQFSTADFSGDGFPEQWTRGFAGVIVEPVDGGFNGLTRLHYSPGVPVPPVVSIQPADRVVDQGDAVVFSAEVSGSQPFDYQWFFGDELIPGATEPSLTIEDARIVDGGNYRLSVRNSPLASVSTRVARLTVVPPAPPKIVIPPMDLVRDIGQTAEFAVEVEGTPPFHYDWYFNDKIISEEHDATLVLRQLVASHAGHYRVEITNASETLAFSAPANLTVITPIPPLVVQAPRETRVVWGQGATLSVVPDGTKPFQYKWPFEGVTIPGETGPSLTLSNLTTDHAGIYRVVIGNRTGVPASAEARLWVDLPPPPVLVRQPQDLTAEAGNSASFTVGAAGVPPIRFQWYFKGTPIEGETAAVLKLDGLTAEHAGLYSVTVSNASGEELLSRGAQLSVVVPLPALISLVSEDSTVAWGQTAEFTVAAEGTPPLEYQWYFQEQPIAEATGTSLLLEGVTLGDSGLYSVTVRNETGLAESGPIKLDVDPPPPPNLVSQPQDVATETGASAHFLVEADGFDQLQFQWYFNGALLTGETRPELKLDEVSPLNAGHYSVVVSNPALVTVSSRNAKLEVAPPILPTIVQQPNDQSVLVGDRVFFEVVAEGTLPWTFQWSHENQELKDSVDAILVLEGVEDGHAGIYQVIVRSPYGFAASVPAILTVVDPSAPPANDQFADRLSVVGLDFHLNQTNANATRETDEPNHAGNAGGRSIWWNWTAPRSGTVTVDTRGSDVDTVLGIYRGNGLGSLVSVASNDDDPTGGVTSYLSFPVEVSERYEIAVDTFGGSSGKIHLNLVTSIRPPKLWISRSGKNLVMSWDVDAVDFSLEFSETIHSTDWSPVESDPIFGADRVSVKVPMLPEGDRFYRLRLIGN